MVVVVVIDVAGCVSSGANAVVSVVVVVGGLAGWRAQSGSGSGSSSGIRGGGGI